MKRDTEALLDAIERFPALSVLVVGDVMLDVYDFCLTEQSKLIPSEKEGKRAYMTQNSIKVLGGAGNVAANLASLGVKASLVSLTGNDEFYFKIREIADSLGVSHVFVRDSSRPTTLKTRLYVDNEYLLRRDDEATHPIDHETSTTLLNEVLRQCATCDAVILSDYNKGIFTQDNAQQIVQECRLHDIPVVVDFKPTNAALFSGADVLSPNDAEATILVPSFSQDDLERSMQALYERLNCGATVVTLGANGLAGTDGQRFFHVPGNPVPAVDEVGCGDTVRTGLALGLAAGLPLEQAAHLANDAAAVIVQKPATALMTPEELIALVKEKG